MNSKQVQLSKKDVFPWKHMAALGAEWQYPVSLWESPRSL